MARVMLATLPVTFEEQYQALNLISSHSYRLTKGGYRLVKFEVVELHARLCIILFHTGLSV